MDGLIHQDGEVTWRVQAAKPISVAPTVQCVTSGEDSGYGRQPRQKTRFLLWNHDIGYQSHSQAWKLTQTVSKCYIKYLSLGSYSLCMHL